MADDAVGWAAAECKEVLNHLGNRSWEYISRDDLPHGRKLVRLIWVYKRKRDGSLKARLWLLRTGLLAGPWRGLPSVVVWRPSCYLAAAARIHRRPHRHAYTSR